MISIVDSAAGYEREQLIRPFGFKGGYLSELWQVVVRLRSASGAEGIGLATQSVLYGDEFLFAEYGEQKGNELMLAVTEEALRLVKRIPFNDPIQLFDTILPEIYERAKSITGKRDLNTNFVYNALVSVDNAAWLLYAAENNLQHFDAMLPPAYRPALAHQNDKIAILYQVPYGMPMEDLKNAVDRGYFIFKIKTGAPGNQQTMLQSDIERLTLIHKTLQHDKVFYTMDANGRYENKETLLRYLDHAKKIGAFDRILLYEEPFVEPNNEEVGDMGVRIAADESIHNEAAALRRLQQGYTTIVLKGIAKTLSATLKIAKLAFDKNIPCICSDLTVNPILIDWHKNLAARLAPFPGIGMGMMETNGDMNYVNWQQMVNAHPHAGASWTERKNGVFELNKAFYDTSAGIFDVPAHYRALL
jgi:L-alanine-DL-glutamate epimerase-like enolase superfamily enzyme